MSMLVFINFRVIFSKLDILKNNTQFGGHFVGLSWGQAIAELGVNSSARISCGSLRECVQTPFKYCNIGSAKFLTQI